MRRVARILAVTLALIAAGAVFGALAGGAAFTLVEILVGEQMTIEAFEIGALFGAPLGAATAPLLGWLLLRRVPLGRMFLVCSIGTIIGGVAGWFLAVSTDTLLTPLMGAFAGCLTPAFGLHMRVQQA